MKKIILILAGIFLVTGYGLAQHERSHAHMILLNFQQIKDEANYGLVFRGPGLGYAYSALWQNDWRYLSYQGSFLFNPIFSKGIAAPSVNITLVRFDYLFRTGSEGKINVGPYAIIDYNLESYPDLQSGYTYWFNHYSLGCAATGWFMVQKSRIDLALHTTLLGFVSKQPIYDNPYFFEGDFGENVQEMHRNLEFGFVNAFSMTEAEVIWIPKEGSRLAYAYAVQFYGYYDDPKMKMLNHTLKLMILPKKDK